MQCCTATTAVPVLQFCSFTHFYVDNSSNDKVDKIYLILIRTHHDDGCNISDSEIWKENKMMIIYHQEWAQDMQLQPNNYEFFCSCRWILFQLMLFIFTELAITEHKSDIYCDFLFN